MFGLRQLFVGCGNMAGAILNGLKDMQGVQFLGIEPNAKRCQELESNFNIKTAPSFAGNHFVQEADVIVLAVKPSEARAVCQTISPLLADKPRLVTSVMAGISVANLQNWLGPNAAIVRTMPNTPAKIQMGATALYAGNNVSEEQMRVAEKIMQAVGITACLDNEAQMNSITALSGSGPAYIFYLMECMQKTAMNFGLEESIARQLALQATLDAANAHLDSGFNFSTLLHHIMMLNQGATITQQHKFYGIMKQAMYAAQARAEEMNQEFSGGNTNDKTSSQATSAAAFFQQGTKVLFDNRHDAADRLLKFGTNMSSACSNVLLHDLTGLPTSCLLMPLAMMHSMSETGVSMGIAPAFAAKFTGQTARGAACVAAMDPTKPFEEYRAEVTSKRGTTEAAINVMQARGLDEVINQAMQTIIKHDGANINPQVSIQTGSNFRA